MLRSFWRFILICADVTNTYLEKNGSYLAAAITYWALFSLIPLSLAIMFILGTFFRGSEDLQARLSLAVNTLVPVSEDTLDNTLQVLGRTRAVTGALSIIGLLWVSTTVFGAIRKSVNTLWGIRQPRRFFYERLIDFSFTAGAGLLMVVPIALTAGVGVLGEFTSTLRTGNPDNDWLTSLLLNVLSPFISLTVFLFIYRYLPNAKVTFREIWPGALAAALIFEGWKAVFLWYTRSFPIYDTVYGPVGALVALLTWIYISANILLVGALGTSRYSAYISSRIEDKVREILVATKALQTTRIGVRSGGMEGEAPPKATGTGEDD
ncbi:MAG: YihY/virulence factor BrkB family protein [Dehalococcoidia bacterium]|nr:YihY/virulence factor BrkB family protein [Dehalococcoidia bacterium]